MIKLDPSPRKTFPSIRIPSLFLPPPSLPPQRTSVRADELDEDARGQGGRRSQQHSESQRRVHLGLRVYTI